MLNTTVSKRKDIRQNKRAPYESIRSEDYSQHQNSGITFSLVFCSFEVALKRSVNESNDNGMVVNQKYITQSNRPFLANYTKKLMLQFSMNDVTFYMCVLATRIIGCRIIKAHRRVRLMRD